MNKQEINNEFGVESNKKFLLKENNQEMKKIINSVLLLIKLSY